MKPSVASSIHCLNHANGSVETSGTATAGLDMQSSLFRELSLIKMQGGFGRLVVAAPQAIRDTLGLHMNERPLAAALEYTSELRKCCVANRRTFRAATREDHERSNVRPVPDRPAALSRNDWASSSSMGMACYTLMVSVRIISTGSMHGKVSSLS